MGRKNVKTRYNELMKQVLNKHGKRSKGEVELRQELKKIYYKRRSK